jgi:hypothetical protein
VLRLGIAGGDASLSRRAQFVFRHRSLQPEQQTVGDDSRSEASSGSRNQRTCQRAQVDEMMPIPRVSCQHDDSMQFTAPKLAGTNRREGPNRQGSPSCGPGQKGAESVSNAELAECKSKLPGAAQHGQMHAVPENRTSFSYAGTLLCRRQLSQCSSSARTN